MTDYSSMGTQELLHMRKSVYEGSDDVDEKALFAELATRGHVPNKAERKVLLRDKHRNGSEHEKKRMRFFKDGHHKPNPDSIRRGRERIWEKYLKLQLGGNT